MKVIKNINNNISLCLDSRNNKKTESSPLSATDKGKPPESNKPYMIDRGQYSKFYRFPSSSKAHKNFLLFSDRLRNL